MCLLSPSETRRCQNERAAPLHFADFPQNSRRRWVKKVRTARPSTLRRASHTLTSCTAASVARSLGWLWTLGSIPVILGPGDAQRSDRSEEHTSELQSREN